MTRVSQCCSPGPCPPWLCAQPTWKRCFLNPVTSVLMCDSQLFLCQIVLIMGNHLFQQKRSCLARWEAHFASVSAVCAQAMRSCWEVSQTRHWSHMGWFKLNSSPTSTSRQFTKHGLWDQQHVSTPFSVPWLPKQYGLIQIGLWQYQGQCAILGWTKNTPFFCHLLPSQRCGITTPKAGIWPTG